MKLLKKASAFLIAAAMLLSLQVAVYADTEEDAGLSMTGVDEMDIEDEDMEGVEPEGYYLGDASGDAAGDASGNAYRNDIASKTGDGAMHSATDTLYEKAVKMGDDMNGMWTALLFVSVAAAAVLVERKKADER